MFSRDSVSEILASSIWMILKSFLDFGRNVCAPRDLHAVLPSENYFSSLYVLVMNILGCENLPSIVIGKGRTAIWNLCFVEQASSIESDSSLIE